MGNGQAAEGLARGIRAIWSWGALGGWTDAELVTMFAETRDEAAFESLVERHGPMVLRVIRDILRNSDSAEDAFQATFLILARKAGSIGRPEAVAAWLHGVARRVARKARSEAETRRHHERIAAERSSTRFVEPTFASERDSTLHDELAGLPESCRVAVLLCYFEGLTYDQAAWRLGVTEATVRGRLARARRQLRGRLTARGATAWSLPALPSTWINPTVRAASRFASGLPGAVPAAVVGLAEGVLRTMIVSPIKATLSLVAFPLIIAASVLASPQQDPVANHPESQLEKPVEAKPRSEAPAPAQADHLALTLDQAIARMLREDTDLKAKFSEIPQAQAEILSARLWANPTFYADSQLVPYGQYTRERPGGHTQYDVNISRPIDLSKKRRTREASAARARNVTQAQYEDAVRQKIDTLSRAFIDAQAAREIAKERTESVAILDRLIERNRKNGKETADLAKLEKARAAWERERDQAIEAGRTAGESLGPMLGLTTLEAARLEVLGDFDRVSEIPPLDALIEATLACRPDLTADRLGLERSRADLKLQSASPLPNSYVLTQDYVFSYWMTPFNSQNPAPWTVGPILPLPPSDRMQVSIQRAKVNVTQRQTELSSAERRVIEEVEQARTEAQATLEVARRWTKNSHVFDVLRKVRYGDYMSDERTVAAALDGVLQQDKYFLVGVDAMVRHRKARTALNTAVGLRVIEQ